jgi:hypothetical protein
VTWRPYLPEPRPAVKLDGKDREPVPLEVLRDARALCANFRVPPRHFRRRTGRGYAGAYWVESDIVAVDPVRAARGGIGDDDGYYVFLIHELVHATGHPSRLGRITIGNYSRAEHDLEEGTARATGWIVLEELGFPFAALEHYALANYDGFPVDWKAAEAAAAWLLE